MMGNINNETVVLAPEKSPKLAEFIGIMLGDGNLYLNKKKAVYNIRISGHATQDKKYLVEHVNALTEHLFGIKFKYYKDKKKDTLYLTLGCKSLFIILKNYGLKEGNKVKNNVKIPDWIFENDEYIKACIRGLIDTDGAVCPITGRKYTYIWFKSAVPNLRKSFEKSMEILNYKIAKWCGNKTKKSNNIAYQTYIGNKLGIRKYYKEIGFNNPKHTERFKLP